MGQSHSNAAADAADDAAAADDASADAALKVAAAAERVAACLVKKVVSATVRSVVEKTAPLYTYEERYSRITGQWYFEATNINWVAHGTLPTGCIASLKKPSYVGARAVGILTESEIDAATSLPNFEEDVKGKMDLKEIDALLKKTVIIKLNGGLGTSMGLSQAKSLLELKDGKSFLSLIQMREERPSRHSMTCG